MGMVESLFNFDPGRNNKVIKFYQDEKYQSNLYKDEVINKISDIEVDLIRKIAKKIQSLINNRGTLIFAGNGGSTAITHHASCDYGKGLYRNFNGKLNAVALGANIPLTFAISNDFGFNNIFVAEFDMLQKTESDLVVLVSSSGNSENIMRLNDAAQKLGLKTIGLTGFTGGRLRKECDFNFHVQSEVYTIVELIHQTILDMVFMELFTDQPSDNY